MAHVKRYRIFQSCEVIVIVQSTQFQIAFNQGSWYYIQESCFKVVLQGCCLSPIFYPYTFEITCSNRGLSLFSYDDDMALDFPDEPSLTIERQYLIDFGSRISN